MLAHDITQALLKTLFFYDPDTGLFERLITTSPNARAGDIAGGLMLNGYWTITVCNKRYYSHRLAFLYMIGDMPKCQVDHINRIRHDNRWANLRLAPNNDMDNNQNHGIQSNNTSGFTGVSIDRRNPNNPWVAEIRVNRKRTHIGYFSTPEAAHAAYIEAKARLHKFNPVQNYSSSPSSTPQV